MSVETPQERLNENSDLSEEQRPKEERTCTIMGSESDEIAGFYHCGYGRMVLFSVNLFLRFVAFPAHPTTWIHQQ
jgi:hypothetical protein